MDADGGGSTTFALVPQLLTLQVFFCITAREGKDLHDFNVKTAFLTVPLDVQLDIILPPVFNTDLEFQRDAKPESFRRRCIITVGKEVVDFISGFGRFYLAMVYGC